MGEIPVSPIYSVELNGQVLIEADLQIKSIVVAFPKDRPKYVVVHVITGGAGCPVTHIVIDLAAGKASVYKLVANCSDYMTTKYVVEGKIKLTFVGEDWFYMNGSFVKAGK